MTFMCAWQRLLPPGLFNPGPGDGYLGGRVQLPKSWTQSLATAHPTALIDSLDPPFCFLLLCVVSHRLHHQVLADMNTVDIST